MTSGNLGGALLLLIACALPVFAGGCSEETEAPAVSMNPWLSGQRLRARLREGGGTSIFLGWVDSELDTACEFLPDDSGVLHCMPITHDNSGAFADADCSERLALYYGSDLCPAPPDGVPEFVTLTLEPRPQTCAGELARSGVWRRGAAYGGEVYFLSDLGCLLGGPNDSAYELGEPVDAVTFVSAKLEEVPFDTGLAARRILAADGAEQTIAVIDQTLETPCLGYLEDYVSAYDDRCVAGHTELVTGQLPFSDAACTEVANVAPLWEEPEGCPPRDRLLVFGEAVGCESSFEVREVGAVLPASISLYDTSGDGSCELESPAEAYLEQGALIPPESLPRLASRFVGDGTLQARAWVDAEGAVMMLLGSQFHDAQADQDCALYEIDGSLRCVAGRGDEGVYLDDACTEPVVPVYEGCTDPPQTGVVIRTTDNCAVVGHAYAVGAAVPTPATLYTSVAGSPCTEATVNAAATYHELGDELPASTFPEVREFVE